jgi:peptide/nickel transport system substrate-binding protein
MKKNVKSKFIIYLLSMGLIATSFTFFKPTTAHSSIGKSATLRVALGSFSKETQDPALEARAATFSRLTQVYDSLVGLSRDTELAPGIAKRWEQAGDGLSWTFYLRQGVQFHEGWGEVTAEDVKFSLERFMNKKAKAIKSSTLRKAIKKVEIIDKYTVRIHTNGLDVRFPYKVWPADGITGLIFSKKYLLEKAGNDFMAQHKLLNRHPIGSGPFKFVEHKRGDHFTYEAVKSHWRETPGFKRLELLLIPDEATAIAMLKAGELDLITVSGEHVKELEKHPKCEVRSIPMGGKTYLCWNGVYWPTPLANKMPTTIAKVRKALSMAINRKEIIQYLMGGYATIPNYTPSVSPIYPDSDESTIEKAKKYAEEVYRYRPEKAKKLLAEAGYPDGFGGIKIYSFARAQGPWIPRLVEMVVGYWSKVGVKAEIVPMDYGAFRPHWIRAKWDDPVSGGHAHINSSPLSLTSEYTLKSILHSKHAIRLMNSPELDKISDTVLSYSDPAKRKELFDEARKHIEDWTTYIMLFHPDTICGINSSTVGAWKPIKATSSLGLLFETIKPK